MANLQAESNRAYLGILWWFFEPILYLLVFYVIFTFVIPRGGDGFVFFLLCGLVFWKWFASSVIQSSSAITTRYVLMQQVYIPKVVFPSIVIVTSSMKFMIIFLIFLVFLLVAGVKPNFSWLVYLPVLLMIQLLLITSVSWLCAALTPFFPDLRVILENAMMLGLFMSGIFFDIREIDPSYQLYFYLNPMAVLLEAYRDVLLSSLSPSWEKLLWIITGSLTVLWLSYIILTKFDRIYPKLGLR